MTKEREEDRGGGRRDGGRGKGKGQKEEGKVEKEEEEEKVRRRHWCREFSEKEPHFVSPMGHSLLYPTLGNKT